MSDIAYIFDVDGTLTLPRQLMDEMFVETFLEWVTDGEKTVYLASGSDIDKIKEQIPEDVAHKCEGIFSCLGNQLWQKNKLVYETKFIPSKKFLSDIQLYLDYGADYPVRTGNHIEHRAGMINFSTVGRDATLEQRKRYKEWDDIHREREDFVDYITSKNSSIEASIGGSISVDIYLKGSDKSQVIKYISNMTSAAQYVFVGDMTDPGGNDHALVKELEQHEGSVWFKVADWEDTRDLICSNEAFA